jgi:hypothetical protein
MQSVSGKSIRSGARRQVEVTAEDDRLGVEDRTKPFRASSVCICASRSPELRPRCVVTMLIGIFPRKTRLQSAPRVPAICLGNE